MSDSHIKMIAEALDAAPQLPGIEKEGGLHSKGGEQKLEGGRLLVGPRGVQFTQHDGRTIQIEADSIVIQMPDGKLVKFEALMSQFGPFDRR